MFELMQLKWEASSSIDKDFFVVIKFLLVPHNCCLASIKKMTKG